jgi:hypothetical protein
MNGSSAIAPDDAHGGSSNTGVISGDDATAETRRRLVQQLRAAAHELGPCPSLRDMTKELRKMDKTGTGQLRHEAFLRAVQTQMPAHVFAGLPEGLIDACFRHLGGVRRGSVSVQELGRFLCEVHPTDTVDAPAANGSMIDPAHPAAQVALCCIVHKPLLRPSSRLRRLGLSSIPGLLPIPPRAYPESTLLPRLCNNRLYL